MDLLTDLAIKYKADKWGKHHYTPIYFDLFQDKRDSVKKVLEIGAGEGASLRMWKDFFPNAMIYCGEIDINRVFIEDRIRIIKCNQSFSDDLFKLISLTGRYIDLFVDDGSHKPEDQIETCLIVMPMLKQDVIYIIEDVADDKVIDSLKQFYDCEVKKVGDRYDDKLIIVRYKNG